MSFGLDEHDGYGVQKDEALGGKFPEAHRASIEVLVGLGEGLLTMEQRRRSPESEEEDGADGGVVAAPAGRGSVRRKRGSRRSL